MDIIEIPNKVSINEVAASYFFVHFLTNTGNVFSKGKNRRGELGLGF
jgi:alpha-tubulin suppressor-like RCC1 family protein